MKTSIKTILALAAFIAIGYTGSAIPPGTGSQHLRFTGVEEVLIPPIEGNKPGWFNLKTRQVITIPSQGGAELELVLLLSYKEVIAPDGSFNMYGRGNIKDQVGGDVIGAVSFMNTGQYLPVTDGVLAWSADGTLVGTIWAGPYAGIVLTENIEINASVDFRTGPPIVNYDASLEGFLLVSDNAVVETEE